MKVTTQLQDYALQMFDDGAVAWAEKQKENSMWVVEVKQASKMDLRSLAQNRLQHQWFRDLSKQGDMTAEEYRAYCKLHFGVPILRLDDEQFREIYDRIIRPLEYEEKLELMSGAIDLPVTSRMLPEQMTLYLFNMSNHWLQQGFHLTKLEHVQEWIKEDEANQERKQRSHQKAGI